MAAGDNPFMVSGGKAAWEKEATPGTAPGTGSDWNSWGPRVGDARDLGPFNTWNEQRTWQNGRLPVFLDLMTQDYGAPLGEFKLQDVRIPGFAWGEEVGTSAGTDFDGNALAGGFSRHTVTHTTNSSHTGNSLSNQFHDEDSDGNNTRATTVYCVMNELEIVGNEAGEVTYTPTLLAQKEDTGVAEVTVGANTTSTFKHYHGYFEMYGQQILRILSYRFRVLNGANRARYWNDTNAKYAYEYPFEDAAYVFTARAVADGKQFSGFGSRDILGLARNGDIGTAKIRGTRTADEDEFQITIGSSNDALALISTPRVRPAAGGKVVYEMDFATRTSQYEYINQTATGTRYFPA